MAASPIVQSLIGPIRCQQVEIRRDNLHGEPVSIERAVMEDHVFAPAHPIEDGPRPRHRTHRKSCAQSLSEGTDVWPDAVILLTSPRSIAEAGDNFVKDQQCATVLRELAKPFEISIARQDATHVGHNGFGDHGGEFAAMLFHDSVECSNVIPGRQYNIVEDCRRDAFRVGNAGRILGRPQLFRADDCARSKDRGRTSRDSDLRISATLRGGYGRGPGAEPAWWPRCRCW